jgi:hypothetical protein
MRKLTKQQFNDIVNCVREDIAAYVAKTKQVFTSKDAEGNVSVNKLQYDDIVYVNNALVNFMLDKDVQKLYNALIVQDTYVREQFLSVLYYCEEHNIYLY